jgi:hypothetical protein
LCNDFVDEAVVDGAQSDADILTPLDLTIAAAMLSKGEPITAADVIGSCFKVVMAEYSSIYAGRAFPVMELGRRSYEAVLSGRPINWTETPDVHNLLVARRLLVIRSVLGPTASPRP